MARHTAKSHKIRKVEILVIQIVIVMMKRGMLKRIFQFRKFSRQSVKVYNHVEREKKNLEIVSKIIKKT